MATPIRWVDASGIEEFSEEAVLAWQRHTGRTLPKEYVHLLRDHHGQGFGNAFVFFRSSGHIHSGAIEKLFYIGDSTDTSQSTVQWNSAEVCGRFDRTLDQDLDTDWPEWFVPFAGNISRGLFCLDFRQDALSPPVVFWDPSGQWEDGDHFSGVCYVATGISQFLDMIEYEDESDPERRLPSEIQPPKVLSNEPEDWVDSRDLWLGW